MSGVAATLTNDDRPRIPVSLRLPASVVDAVEAYAHDNGLRKTDAYLHFLRRGIADEDFREDAVAHARIESKLDAILETLKCERSASERLDSDRVRDAVSTVAAEFPAIERAYLFGSFARGTQRPESDVDVRIELDRTRPFNLHDLSHFMKRIEQLTGREVDVVSATHIKNAALADAIEREKVLVYERAEQ